MILITGATGNVGREVVKLLLEDGEAVAAVTRNPATAALPSDTHVVSGDPSRPSTLSSALRGVDAVLISPRALGDATAGVATAELLALAAAQGVKRVVALSAATVEYPAGYRRFVDAFRAVEDGVTASGLQWTILRSVDYASNALAWARQIRASGAVRGAYGQAATSTIHERDVAAVAVQALRNTEHLSTDRPAVAHSARQSPSHRRGHRKRTFLAGSSSATDSRGPDRAGCSRGCPRPVARLAGRLRQRARPVVAHR
jgi:uncharacterized protein YbjT (DUF2867 family)